MRDSTLYGLAHTRTMRRNSRKLFDIWGGNLQNKEKSIRQMYIPDGYKPALKEKCLYFLKTGDLKIFTDEELHTLRIFVQVDQSGAEALIVAYLCRNASYRQLFINGIKPHSFLAMHLFKDVWTKKMKERGGLIEDLNIDELCSLSIPDLAQNPFWHDLDLVVKSSDNWQTSERYYYFAKQTCHCVDEKTEVLTLDGWRPIAEMKQRSKELIATFDFGGNIYFETPSVWNEFDYVGDMFHFEGDETDQYVTSNHKMVHYNSSMKKYYNEQAWSLAYNTEPRIPTSGVCAYGKINLPSWQIKLLAAIQADGYIRSKHIVQFRLAKSRKCERLREILTEGNVEFEERNGGITTNDLVVVEFWLKNIEHILYHFGDKKQWGPWLLKFSQSNLSTLVNELNHWDGTYQFNFRHKREEFCSNIWENIEWVKTICHLVKRQGTIGKPQHGVWKVGLNNRFCSRAKVTKFENQTLKVYCPTVSTGMFLIRRNRKISITGNSANYGIEENTFRMNVLDKSGGKVVISAADAKKYLQTYRGLFPEIPEWNEHVKDVVRQTKMLYNLFGYPYQITNYNITDSDMKEYIAWIPQSTVGQITETAFTNLQEYIESERKDWDIMADTHDSYLVQGPLFDVKERIAKMSEFMNQSFESPLDKAPFSMRSEYAAGFNWAPKHKEKNPEGLQELKWLAA